MNKYDLLIIGTGPAGLSAGLYASRYKINHLLIGQVIGGQILTAYKINNFPTEIDILGVELAKKMEKVVNHYQVNIKRGKVMLIEKKGDNFLVHLENKEKIASKTVILATGTERRKLGLEKEDTLAGRGVHYCATCDGPFYKDKVVAVVGGGNAALTAAIFLADICSKVYLICREKGTKDLRAESAWIDNILANKKIEILWGTNVKKLMGDKFLQAVVLDKEYQGKKEIKLDGLFVEIGGMPVFSKIAFPLSLAPNGAIEVKPSQETNVKGFFAAGDVSSGSNGIAQIVTALSEGMIAADSAFKYLKKMISKNGI